MSADRVFKSCLMSTGCILSTVIFIVACIAVLLFYDACLPKHKSETDVKFRNKADIEELLGLDILPVFSFEEAVVYRGVTSERFKFQTKLDSVEYLFISERLKAEYPSQTSFQSYFLGLTKENYYANLSLSHTGFTVDYGHSNSDYPRQVLEDSLKIKLPPHRQICYCYIWQVNRHFTRYEFDSPQSEELFESVAQDFIQVEWQNTTNENLYHKIIDFSW